MEQNVTTRKEFVRGFNSHPSATPPLYPTLTYPPVVLGCVTIGTFSNPTMAHFAVPTT